MPSQHAFAAVTPLPTNTGEILVTGGLDGSGMPTALAAVYSPAQKKFIAPAPPGGTSLFRGQMLAPRVGHVAVAAGLNDVVIIYGGNNGSSTISKPEVFVPAAGVVGAFLDTQVTGSGSMLMATQYAQALAVGERNIIVVGGEASGTPLANVVELQAIDSASSGGAQPFHLNAVALAPAAPARARASLARNVDGSLLLVGGGVGGAAAARIPTDASTTTAAQLMVPCSDACKLAVTLSP